MMKPHPCQAAPEPAGGCGKPQEAGITGSLRGSGAAVPAQGMRAMQLMIESESAASSASSSSEPPAIKGGLIDLVDRDFEFHAREARRSATASSKEGSSQKRKRPVLIDDSELLMEEVMEHLSRRPQSLAIEILCQLETHERLHQHYQSGDLPKCMLSYYLLVMADDCMQFLHHLGSSMVPGDYHPSDEPLASRHLSLTCKDSRGL
jgi:hypothetical protein